MASLDEIFETFAAKTSNLKRCMDIRNAAKSPACMCDLHAIDREMGYLEQGLQELRSIVDEEKRKLGQARALKDVTDRYKDWLQHAANNLPRHLPGQTIKDCRYSRGRMTYDQVNKAIDEIHKVVDSKYKIVNLPRSSMGESVMNKYKAFKEAECKETDGLYFFVEDDIKSYSGLKMDAKGRALLTVLRLSGRITEVRTEGLLRYALKD
ncbi:spindle and kinetochore-associated protein 1 isoform X2 [Nematostella vectensis]|uniref:spindle and kinetochore-associated protein 1 isoform X2 n=1 Tax=Nematostella vectensis TaxID=45351 RepID=UPI0020775533|nr:spindle and kinetochore-associated protein 1 isoform X2 [Nematostella vectensis]